MGKRRLKLQELRKILISFDVVEDAGRGKGSHTCFQREIDGKWFSYPVPTNRDVKPCYVKGVRKKLRLLPDDGVADEDFFGRR